MSIESVMPSNPLIICRSLRLLPSVSSCITVFSNKSALWIRWPKYCSSTSASVFPMNIQGWFPLGLTGLIFLESKELSRIFSSTTIWNHQFFGSQISLWSNSHQHMTTGKPIVLIIWTFVLAKWCLCFLTYCPSLSKLFYQGASDLISWLQSLSAVILKPPKRKSVTVSTFSSSICHEVMGLDAMILVFWMFSFKPVFSLSSLTLIKRLRFLISAILILGIHPACHFPWCTLRISWISRVTI